MSEEDNILDDIMSSLQEATEAPKLIGKRGRRASLTRAQVETIKLDTRPNDIIAMVYGVSPATVYRAKHHDYRTAEEDGAHSYMPTTRGRRLKSGHVLGDEERAAIAADLSPAKQVAHAYGVSVSYVYKIRHELGTSNDRRRQTPLPREVIDAIRASEVGDDELAQLFDLSPLVVKSIRSGYDQE